MRAPAVSRFKNLWSALFAALMIFLLLPASALAEGESETNPESSASNPSQAEGAQGTSVPQEGEGASSVFVASPTEGSTLASVLVGAPTAFVHADVAFGSELVIGSFTVDGMTFAVTEGSNVSLVSVSSDWRQSPASQVGAGSPAAPMLASGSEGTAAEGLGSELAEAGADSLSLALPESVAYEGTDYVVSSISAYAFYLSGATSVELPASVSDVNERAFRSSDVASVGVADGNPTYSSSDGALYDATQSSLLLIPEGKQGTVRIPSTAEVVEPSAFSHCALVKAISVDAGSAAFASENGLLYDASLTALLRVPAGATDITIHDGCAAIAAGAMEGCANLVSITAPATVVSISPDVFTCVPTISLPVAAVVGETPQTIAVVPLSLAGDGVLPVSPESISVLPQDGTAASLWEDAGFSIQEGATASQAAEAFEVGVRSASPESAATYAADGGWGIIVPSKPVYYRETQSGTLRPGGTWEPTPNVPFQVSSTIAGNLYRLGVFNNSFIIQRSSDGTSQLEIGFNGSYGGVTKLEATWNFMTYQELTNNAYWSWQESAGQGRFLYFALNGARPRWQVDFDLAGGTSGQPSSFQIVYGKSLPAISTSTPVRAGYVFEGWWDDVLNQQYYDASGQPVIAAWDQVADVTLVAHWRDAGHLVMVSDAGELHYRVGSGSWQTIGCNYAGCDFATTSSVSTWVSGGQAFIENHGKVLAFSYSAPGASDVTKLEYTFDYKTYTPITATSQANAQTVSWSDKALFCLNGSRPKWAVTFDLAGGTSEKSPTVYAVYAESLPSIMATHTLPERPGYAFQGWYAPNGAMFYDELLRVQARFPYLESVVLTARWSLQTYSVQYELDGGSTSGNPATYDVTTPSFTLKNPERTGYLFTGWSGTGLAGEANMVVTVPRGSTGNRTYTAHWQPVISAVVPLEVEARVDRLGVEGQTPAVGYIESRCQEALTVVDLAFEPLTGAAELFGAGNVADVSLEVLAEGSLSPDARFALSAFASQAPASSTAFRMASYGDRVPISYRFAIPDALLPVLPETTKPICVVSYTVELA